ncbi:MAG: PQQ-binding-like beta-propeller repeat protein [Pirellulaceae bacterium]|nr:PQQ-binding-like beta-propeller repeat protein [Pirellulaceae bacterium]
MIDRTAYALMISLCLACGETCADDWSQFLGPDRTGISSETQLFKVWPQDGPPEVWRVPGGVGMSGLAIQRGKLLTMIQTARDQEVICMDSVTGKTLWRTAVAPAYRNPQGNGPRATPTIVGGQVLTFSGAGVLTALNLMDGSILWRHDLVKQFAGEVADYGMACSPLVVGDRVVVTIGAPTATIVALNRDSGELAWKAGRSSTAGYSSPVLLHVGGRLQIVAFVGKALLGIDPDSGSVLWSYPFKTDFDCNIAAPIAYRDQVFISAGENHGCVMLRLVPDGDQFKPTPVWSSVDVKSVMRNEWQTSILLDGFLYGFDNVGSAGPVTHLTCVNAQTGERVWRKTRFGKGNLISAGGKLFISTMAGDLVVVKATPDRYEEMGRQNVMVKTRQSPALADGRLYLRDRATILCLDIREP